MPTLLLTARLVDQLKPEKNRREIADRLLPGLYLIIQPSGARSWALRYRAAGRPAKFTLGPAIAERQQPIAANQAPAPGMALTLGEARQVGRELLAGLAEGRAPHVEARETRRKRHAGLSAKDELGAVFENYLDRHVRRRLRATTIRDVEGLFRREVLAHWGRRRLAEISRSDVIDLLDDIVERGRGVTANKLLRVLGTFFRWTIDRDLLAVSPTANVRKPAIETSRDRWLSDAELRWLWSACGTLDYPFGPMTRLLLLIGARREEVRAMTWRELDLEAASWTIPAARVKNGIAHTVALSDQAMKILFALPRIKNPAGFVFTTNATTACSGFSRAKRNLDAGMIEAAAEDAAKRSDDRDELAPLAPWTVHDLRRTMASGMARLGIALPVIEKCLNHLSGSFGGIVAVYQHHDFGDEKRAAWSAWGQHVETVAAGKSFADSRAPSLRPLTWATASLSSMRAT